MTIKAITFDFWQTLYKSKPFDFDERLRQTQADVNRGSNSQFTLDEIRAAVTVARDAWTNAWATEHRTISANECLSIMLAQLGASLSPADKQQMAIRMENSILKNKPVLVDEARTVLAELATRYSLAIISDTGITPGRVLRQIMVEDNVADYFTHLTFSDELGRSKPHPDAFLATLNALNAKPEEGVHIGDLLRTDIIGAQGVGMRGVQYVGVNKDEFARALDLPPDSPVTPDAVIDNHAKLLPLLKSWNGSV